MNSEQGVTTKWDYRILNIEEIYGSLMFCTMSKIGSFEATSEYYEQGDFKAF